MRMKKTNVVYEIVIISISRLNLISQARSPKKVPTSVLTNRSHECLMVSFLRPDLIRSLMRYNFNTNDEAITIRRSSELCKLKLKIVFSIVY